VQAHCKALQYRYSIYDVWNRERTTDPPTTLASGGWCHSVDPTAGGGPCHFGEFAVTSSHPETAGSWTGTRIRCSPDRSDPTRNQGPNGVPMPHVSDKTLMLDLVQPLLAVRLSWR
jgi:hypothetical protein